MNLVKNKFDYGLITLSLAFMLSLSACAKVTEKTANNGDAQAQFKMGMYYFDGKGGVSTDYYKAADWFQKSAVQGYNPAQLALGSIYNLDYFYQDYPYSFKDKELAKEWFGKACDSGNQEGCNSYRRLN